MVPRDPQPHPEEFASGGAAGPHGCLLTFHRVVPAAEWASLPDRGFHLDLDRLDRLLRHLRRTGWAIVTMDEVVTRLQRNLPGRFVNFSIDDVYRDTFEHAVPLFRRHDAPLTIHVTTGFVAEHAGASRYRLWRAGLETLLQRRDSIVPGGIWGTKHVRIGRPRAKRAMLRALCRAWEQEQAELQYRRFCARNGADAEALAARHAVTWPMLAELVTDPGIEIGAHTVSHPRVSALDEQDALAELAGSRHMLEQRLGIPVRHFAFPYGRRGDCGPRDHALARRAGFVTAATTSKGILRGGGWRLQALPRNTLHGARLRPAEVGLHLSGVSGRLARLLGRD